MSKSAVKNCGIDEKEGNENQNRTLESKPDNIKLRLIIFVSIGITIFIGTLICSRYFFNYPQVMFPAYIIAILLWILHSAGRHLKLEHFS